MVTKFSSKGYSSLSSKFVGDGKSQLQICGVYAGNKAVHPSRACLVQKNQLSDYHHICQWRRFSDIEGNIMDCLKSMKLVELLNHEEHKQYNEEELTSRLKALSIHPHNNAYFVTISNPANYPFVETLVINERLQSS